MCLGETVTPNSENLGQMRDFHFRHIQYTDSLYGGIDTSIQFTTFITGYGCYLADGPYMVKVTLTCQQGLICVTFEKNVPFEKDMEERAVEQLFALSFSLTPNYEADIQSV